MYSTLDTHVGAHSPYLDQEEISYMYTKKKQRKKKPEVCRSLGPWLTRPGPAPEKLQRPDGFVVLNSTMENNIAVQCCFNLHF